MTDFYCEPGLYTYAAGSGTAALAAQEGDGSAMGAATRATLSIDLTGITAAAGNTISVAGATLTCVASGAGNNQFNAGSGSTLAANLVTAINRSTNTATVAAAAAGWGTPPVQNACYAWSSGATLNIQTRAGSAVYNANASFQVVQSGITGLTGPWQFSGGAGGAWGWLFNDQPTGTLWPTAEARFTYGCWFTATKTRPLAGVLTANGDIVHIRANNRELLSAAAGGSSATTSINVTAAGTFLVDNGTVWTGDTGTLTLRHAANMNYSLNILLPPTAGVVFSFGARTLGRLVLVNNSGGGAANLTLATSDTSGLGTVHNLFKILLRHTGTGGSTHVNPGREQNVVSVRECKWEVTTNVWFLPFDAGGGNYHQRRLYVDDVVLDFSAFVGTPTLGILALTGNNAEAVFRNVKLISANPGPMFNSINVNVSNYPYTRITAENCSGFDQSATFLGYVGINAATFNNGRTYDSYLLLQNVGAGRSFRIENPEFYLDWFAGKGFPVADSYLPDGTPWSYRFYWSGNSSVLRPGQVTTALALTKTNILSAGARTIAMELLVDDAYDHLVTGGHLSLVVTYTRNSDNAVVREASDLPHELFTAGAIISSSKAWTLNSYSGYVARKLQITTAESVKANTEIEARLVVWRPAPATYLYVFVNPELTIT